MIENDVESSNVHLSWLEFIFEKLKNIDGMIKLAREGSDSLMDYLEVPYEMRQVLLPDSQYKNLRFLVLEMDTLITNLSPMLKDKTDKYKKNIKIITDVMDKRELFLRDIKKNNKIEAIQILPLFNQTLNLILNMHLEIIKEKEVSSILYMSDDTNKKW